jgi:hypothetical protein
MFRKQEITLVRPRKWDDPFENYITSAKFNLKDGSFRRLPERNLIYGTCWTKKAISDAMWRIYSPDKISVRIKSTPTLVANELNAALSNYKKSGWYIGKVSYLTQKKIVQQASKLAKEILDKSSENAAAKSVLFKRNAFSHEQEVRILVCDRHKLGENGILHIKCDPHNIVQSVLTDSRAPDEWLDIYSTYLRDTLGYKGSINKSVLYNPLEPLVIS